VRVFVAVGFRVKIAVAASFCDGDGRDECWIGR